MPVLFCMLNSLLVGSRQDDGNAAGAVADDRILGSPCRPSCGHCGAMGPSDPMTGAEGAPIWLPILRRHPSRMRIATSLPLDLCRVSKKGPGPHTAVRGTPSHCGKSP